MKKLSILISLVLVSYLVSNAQLVGAGGHRPFEHAHSTGGTGGLCYGYAMGKSAGTGGGAYSNCDEETIIPTSGSWAG